MAPGGVVDADTELETKVGTSGLGDQPWGIEGDPGDYH
jgi:hypothetical protein